MPAGAGCVGVLLAGGAARRFGGFPKGLAIVDEVRIADRALAALRGATETQLVVSNDARAASWFPGMRVVPDDEPALGPLGGLATALRAAQGSAVLVVAWDMPFVPAPLLRGMRARGDIGAGAVVPVHGDPPRAEPLCAYYSAGALATCLDLLARGERRAAALAESLEGVITIPEVVLAEHGEPSRIFTSVDSLAELERLGGSIRD
jgi:molybdopterin-guanine dinucleotide biosynthesis protein A